MSENNKDHVWSLVVRGGKRKAVRDDGLAEIEECGDGKITWRMADKCLTLEGGFDDLVGILGLKIKTNESIDLDAGLKHLRVFAPGWERDGADLVLEIRTTTFNMSIEVRIDRYAKNPFLKWIAEVTLASEGKLPCPCTFLGSGPEAVNAVRSAIVAADYALNNIKSVAADYALNDIKSTVDSAISVLKNVTP